MVGVGDCKAFLLSVSGDSSSCIASEITIGSRNETNITDPCDPGGRLGPQQKQGDPDLRNLSCWFSPCSTGDIVLLCSDGVHDNLDPQTFGLPPSHFGLNYENWSDAPPKEVVEVKRAYTLNLLQKFYSELYSVRGCVTLHNLTETIITYCFEQTLESRKFMETNPHLALPKDQVKYPGKMDHASCVCIKVGESHGALNLVSGEVEGLSTAMKEPATGLKTRPFQGKDVIDWLTKKLRVDYEEANEKAQLLLDWEVYMQYSCEIPSPAFRHTNFYEFLNKSLVSYKAEHSIPILKCLHHFHALSMWTKLLILEQDLVQRQNVISKLLGTCYILKILRNFHSLFGIMNGLRDPAIASLTESWAPFVNTKLYTDLFGFVQENVDTKFSSYLKILNTEKMNRQKEKETNTKTEGFHESGIPEEDSFPPFVNGAEYLTCISSISSPLVPVIPVIPFLHYHLHSFWTENVSSPDYYVNETGDGINFKKCFKLARDVESLLELTREAKYNHPGFPAISEYVTRWIEGPSTRTSDRIYLFKKSTKIENEHRISEETKKACTSKNGKVEGEQNPEKEKKESKVDSTTVRGKRNVEETTKGEPAMSEEERQEKEFALIQRRTVQFFLRDFLKWDNTRNPCCVPKQNLKSLNKWILEDPHAVEVLSWVLLLNEPPVEDNNRDRAASVDTGTGFLNSGQRDSSQGKDSASHQEESSRTLGHGASGHLGITGTSGTFSINISSGIPSPGSLSPTGSAGSLGSVGSVGSIGSIGLIGGKRGRPQELISHDRREEKVDRSTLLGCLKLFLAVPEKISSFLDSLCGLHLQKVLPNQAYSSSSHLWEVTTCLCSLLGPTWIAKFEPFVQKVYAAPKLSVSMDPNARKEEVNLLNEFLEILQSCSTNIPHEFNLITNILFQSLSRHATSMSNQTDWIAYNSTGKMFLKLFYDLLLTPDLFFSGTFPGEYSRENANSIYNMIKSILSSTSVTPTTSATSVAPVVSISSGACSSTTWNICNNNTSISSIPLAIKEKLSLQWQDLCLPRKGDKISVDAKVPKGEKYQNLQLLRWFLYNKREHIVAYAQTQDIDITAIDHVFL
eukprot:TRINITY_DN4681_c1_g1_i4.p1 TRINITY_DN4681_c1_g1~~TRINITY_DN4681_c1_g1_i4.p1  ORF type:complete len:1082 (+),score=187.13 TRINITY_DN4681_c1_g1_i4:1314-4559(+)